MGSDTPTFSPKKTECRAGTGLTTPGLATSTSTGSTYDALLEPAWRGSEDELCTKLVFQVSDVGLMGRMDT